MLSLLLHIMKEGILVLKKGHPILYILVTPGIGGPFISIFIIWVSDISYNMFFLPAKYDLGREGRTYGQGYGQYILRCVS